MQLYENSNPNKASQSNTDTKMIAKEYRKQLIISKV